LRKKYPTGAEKIARNGKHGKRRKTGARRMSYHYSMVIQ
jgi:hypothetical protein